LEENEIISLTSSIILELSEFLKSIYSFMPLYSFNEDFKEFLIKQAEKGVLLEYADYVALNLPGSRISAY
jgi:hypothetical protein